MRQAYWLFRVAALHFFFIFIAGGEDMMLTVSVILSISLPCAGTETPWRTSFQSAQPWSPGVDLQTDAALVYGVWGDYAAKVQSYADQGYQTELMTGVAWGEYQDYVEGRFDGEQHHDEAQVARDGKPIMHHDTVPYFVPSASYRTYLKSLIAKAIDAGVTGIHLEEPEFWSHAGYSEGFKREYQRFYGESWRPPHESVDARYRAEKLKYVLYRDTLAELFAFAKDYARRQGRAVRCYVPTHSLINYACWRIISPMSSLMALPEADGYIAQVWTGTARTANIYRGVARERTFETAYLEYAQAVSMIRPTGRTCILLADPVEDDPNHGWDDYEFNYRRVLVASLLHPEVHHYEVMPWPDRVFLGRYPASEEEARKRDSANPPERIPIPPDYATVLLTCANALNHMRVEAEQIRWDAGPPSTGVLVADSMMFQRGEPSPSDPHLSSFFGLALPLLKHGIPVKVVQMETLTSVQALHGLSILLLTYEHMKPPQASHHDVLAAWVRDHGGGLLLYETGEDPYHRVREWWNQPPNAYAHPAQHLLEQLGLPRDATPAAYVVGRGKVRLIHASPAALAQREDGAREVREQVRSVMEAVGQGEFWREQAHIVLHRGPFCIAANMDEGPGEMPIDISGAWVDLFDASLPVRFQPALKTGEVMLLRNAAPDEPAVVLAAAGRVRNETADEQSLAYQVRGPSGTTCSARLKLPREPVAIIVKDEHGPLAHQAIWDASSATLLLRHEHRAAPIDVRCAW